MNRIPVAGLPLLAALILGQYQLSTWLDAPTPDSIQKTIQTAMSTSTDDQQRSEQVRNVLIHSLQSGRSIAPTVTRFEMTRLIIVVAAFFLGSQLFATSSSQIYLWLALAFNGAVLAFFGFAQQMSWNGKMFWVIPIRNGGHVFASFINRNNAAGYLCICLACAIGVVIWSFSDILTLVRAKNRIAPNRGHVNRRLENKVLSFVSQVTRLSAAQLTSVVLVSLSAAGVVLAASRGGWLAMALATLATLFFSVKDHRGSAARFVAVVALLCVGLVVWTNQEKRLSSRWNDLVSIENLAANSRLDHWNDMLKAVQDFALTGTGFGTYQFANLPYQQHPKLSHLRFYHADNQFLEWLVEGGFIGLTLVFVFLLCGMISVLALLKRNQIDSIEPGGTIGFFLIVSQCVSAFFDFGPTMPGNMLALATLFGATTGRAALLASSGQIERRKWSLALPGLGSNLLIPALGVALLVAGFWGVKDVNAAAAVHDVTHHLPVLDSLDAFDESLVTPQIDRLEHAITNYPGDSDAHKALADLYLLRFRLQEFAFEMDRSPGLRREEIWERTNPAFLLRQVDGWERTQQFERVELLLTEPTIVNNLERCYSHLIKAQEACQLAPGVDQHLAMLSFLVPAEKRFLELHLRRALAIAPSSAESFFVVGELALQADLKDFSYSSLKRSLELSPLFLPQIHQSLQGRISLDEEIENVLPQSGEILIELAGQYTVEKDLAIRHDIAKRAIQQLSVVQEGLLEAERRHSLGRAHEILSEVDEAIEEYHQALYLLPLHTRWRADLIRYLQLNKDTLSALREAEIAAAIDPNQKQFQTLVHDLRSQADLQNAPATRSTKASNR